MSEITELQATAMRNELVDLITRKYGQHVVVEDFWNSLKEKREYRPDLKVIRFNFDVCVKVCKCS